MGIDHGIYNNLLRPPKSVADYDNEAMEVQRNRLILQEGNQKQDAYRRSLGETNALANVYRGATGADGTVDRNKLYSGVAQAGFGAKIPAMQKEYAELDETAAKAGYQTAQTGKVKQETASKSHEAVGQTLGALSQVQGVSPAHVQRAMEHLVDIGMASPEFAQKVIAGAPQDPSAMQQWLITGRNAVMGVAEQRKFTDVDANTKANNDNSLAKTKLDNEQADRNNMRTVGASYANAAATRSIASATRDAATIQRDMQTEMKLGDDYRKQSKDFKDVGDAYRTINATLDKATTSPAATLAAATKFMKLLDPGSVVRESELGMAMAASGVFDRATNYFNVLQSGRVLTPNQVKDFKSITQQIYGAAQAGQREIDTSYTKQAQQYKLRPEMVVQDLGQNSNQGGAKTTRPTKNAQGWALHTDASGNQAYVSPDGKQFKEVN